MSTENMKWLCNTPALLKELIDCNPHSAMLIKPVQIFGHMLSEVADRAAELNDPQLNLLMCRLALYEIGDPNNKNYDKEKVEEIKQIVEELKAG